MRKNSFNFDFARFCLFLEGLILFVMFEVKEVELVANKVNSSLIVVHRRPKVTIPVWQVLQEAIKQVLERPLNWI